MVDVHAIATPFTRIIAAVRDRPELWSRQHAIYKNRVFQKEIWGEIAKKLRMDESLIKKRWKHLKDQYRKELKKSPNPSQPNSPWVYFQYMDFLRGELLQAIKEKNQEMDSDKEERQANDKALYCESESSYQKINTMSVRVGRMTELLESHVAKCVEDSPRDPDMMYLMSLLPSVQKLTDIQKLQFRGKINDWLLEAMAQNEFTSRIDSVSPTSHMNSNPSFFEQSELNSNYENDNQ